MKAKWQEQNIKDLFDCVAKDLQKNVPSLESFKKYAQKTGKNALSVRNFYYQQLKVFYQNKVLAKKIGIDLRLHKVQNFKHFDKQQEQILKNKIDALIKKGYSVRRSCAILSNGDIQEMLRLQNKYRTIKKQEYNLINQNKNINCKIANIDEVCKHAKIQNCNTEQTKNIKVKNVNIEQNNISKPDCKIIQFPQSKKDKKQTLSDEEIKSLFMGLVKLVKQNAIENSTQNMQIFLEQTEMQKRREIVLLKQKQAEIESLNQEIANLKQKNKILNEKLTDYRVKYLNIYRKDIIIE